MLHLMCDLVNCKLAKEYLKGAGRVNDGESIVPTKSRNKGFEVVEMFNWSRQSDSLMKRPELRKNTFVYFFF